MFSGSKHLFDFSTRANGRTDVVFGQSLVNLGQESDVDHASTADDQQEP